MATHRVERRIAAVVAVDMAGYSRLMETNETGTLAALKAHRKELIDPTITEHNGRIVKTTGDGFLIEFASVVDALASTVAIQRAIAARNELVRENQRIQFRIGINLGDIIIDGDDIFGDGVNIAARLEQLADPGGICISGTAYDQLKSQVDVGYADLGEQSVKNIERPVRVYRVLLDIDTAGTVIAAPKRRSRLWKFGAVAVPVMATFVIGGIVWWTPWATQFYGDASASLTFPLPDNPSIAILPFNNLSGDDFAEVLLLDVAESVAKALSVLPDFLVVARSSTQAYKDKTVNVQQVADELGVRYVLEGSVRRSGNQVQIRAKLTDAQTASNLWGGVYDRDLQHASAVRDEITQSVVGALEAKLVDEASALIVRGNTISPEAYTLVRRGLAPLQSNTKAENAEARRLFEKAVELDPAYSIAWHLLSYALNASSRRGWSDGSGQERVQAEILARKALTEHPSASGPYILLSALSLQGYRHDEAVAFSKRAAALAPNDAMVVAHVGRTLAFVARSGEAIPVMQRAIDLRPYTPPPILFMEGLSHNSLGRYEEAISEFESTAIRSPTRAPVYALLAITSAELDRMDEARVAARAVLKVKPDFSAEGFVRSLEYKDRSKSERAIAALRQLGIAK